MNRKKLLVSLFAVAIALFGQGNLVNAAETEEVGTAAVTAEVLETPRAGLARNWTTMRVTANGVNFRSAPNTTTSTILGQVQAGNIGALITTNGNWVQLQMLSGPNNGRRGWVSRDFLAAHGTINVLPQL
ncbi:MAG: SH3 domain-containing protein [Turicibacter sp.]|nr:SH3 domain-containing protein [Turicibacter sp.]